MAVHLSALCEYLHKADELPAEKFPWLAASRPKATLGKSSLISRMTALRRQCQARTRGRSDGPTAVRHCLGRTLNGVLPVGLFRVSGLHPIKLKPTRRGILREELVCETR